MHHACVCTMHKWGGQRQMLGDDEFTQLSSRANEQEQWTKMLCMDSSYRTVHAAHVGKQKHDVCLKLWISWMCAQACFRWLSVFGAMQMAQRNAMGNGQIPPRTKSPWTKSPSDRIPLLKDTGRTKSPSPDDITRALLSQIMKGYITEDGKNAYSQ